MKRQRGAISYLVLGVLAATLMLGLPTCGSDSEPVDAEAWRAVVNNLLRDGFFDVISGDERLRTAVLELVADDEPDLYNEITSDDLVTRGELRSTAVSMDIVNGFASGLWTSVGDVDFEDPAAIRETLSIDLRDHVIGYLHSITSLRSALAPEAAETVTADSFADVPAVVDLADDVVRQILFQIDAILTVADVD